MLKTVNRKLKKDARHSRVRGKVQGTAERPRLAVFRSLRFISVQAIDDTKGVTLAAAHSKEVGKKATLSVGTAEELAKIFAGKLKKAGIENVVFDRGGYKYHGRVKALAEGLRTEGIVF
jgi:large subunit ribosomal protein L18